VRRNASVFVILCIAILAMVASGKYLSRSRQSKNTSALVGDVRGLPAPDFELTSLDGKVVKLSDFRGKAVLLNFWATWCSPCKIEMPWFVELQKKYGNDGLVVVGIAMDDTDAPKIAQFTSEMGVNYPVLLGTDKISEDYGNVQYLPTSFYIDREGKLIGKGTGLLGREEIEQNVQRALAAHVAGANEPKSASVPRDAVKQPATSQ
jgi:thiol-disulfide isomerase/thioredoxin